MDVGLHGWMYDTAWLGVYPGYSRSYQRYTAHERAVYFKSNLI